MPTGKKYALIEDKAGRLSALLLLGVSALSGQVVYAMGPLAVDPGIEHGEEQLEAEGVGACSVILRGLGSCAAP